MRDGEYVAVMGSLRLVRPKSILFAAGDGAPHERWIPRSCIHGGDECSLDQTVIGAEITIRIFGWLARREDLI